MRDECELRRCRQLCGLILLGLLSMLPAWGDPAPAKDKAPTSRPAQQEPAPLPPLTVPSNDTLPPVTSSPTLSLAEVQQAAIETSPVLRDYRSRKVASRFRVDEAYTQAAPTIGLSANYTHIYPPLALSLGPLTFVGIAEHNYDVTLTLRQAIYTFGRLKWSAADAELQEKASKADLTYQQALVFENATIAYYMAGEASEQVRIAQKNYATRKAHLADAQSLVDAGVSPAYDVKRDESALATAEQQLLEAQNRRALALVQLYVIMGIPQDNREPVQGDLTLTPPPSLLPLQQVVASRQDLEAERWAREAALARVSVARTGDAPRLDFETDVSHRNPLTIQPGDSWVSVVQFSFPIFDGGLTKAKVGEANQVVEQLSAQYDNAVRQVKLEVDSYYLDMVNRWKKIEVTQRALEAAQEAARIALLRYQNGLSPNLENLDAESTLTQAEQDVVTARFDYLVSWAHYRRAGGL